MKYLVLLCSLCLIGCTVSSSSSQAPVTEPEVIVNSYENALKASALKKKPLFLYFGASWCGPCQQIKANTFQTPEVQKRFGDFVVWFVDIDKDANLKQKYGVTAVPTYFVVDSNEKILGSSSGYRQKKDFLEWLSKY